jgi:rare lipoprotein A
MSGARCGGLMLLLLASLLSACASSTVRRGHSPAVVAPNAVAPPNQDYAPAADEIPADIINTPDAVPQEEPRARSGNAKTYTVFGETYSVLENAEGFHQHGYASWYGKKFHGRKTASGERYDIYGMTAAHKTLPLPTYVRVTNLSNGKTVVVRVNDRGPFHSERIIDLSYTAAAKLGIIGHGTSMVDIETVTSAPPQEAPPPMEEAPVVAQMNPIGRSGYLQVAAYTDAINAIALREELQQNSIGPVEIRISDSENPPIHHVMVGPFKDESAADETRRRLEQRSLSVEWINE